MHTTFVKRDRLLKWELRLDNNLISRHTKRKYAMQALYNYLKKHRPEIHKTLYDWGAYKYNTLCFNDTTLLMVDKLYLARFKFVVIQTEWVLGRWIK